MLLHLFYILVCLGGFPLPPVVQKESTSHYEEASRGVSCPAWDAPHFWQKRIPVKSDAHVQIVGDCGELPRSSPPMVKGAHCCVLTCRHTQITKQQKAQPTPQKWPKGPKRHSHTYTQHTQTHSLKLKYTVNRMAPPVAWKPSLMSPMF